jgi:hypothetical protein
MVEAYNFDFMPVAYKIFNVAAEAFMKKPIYEMRRTVERVHDKLA